MYTDEFQGGYNYDMLKNYLELQISFFRQQRKNNKKNKTTTTQQNISLISISLALNVM